VKQLADPAFFSMIITRGAWGTSSAANIGVNENEECAQSQSRFSSIHEQSIGVNARFLTAGGVFLSWKRYEAEQNALVNSVRDSQGRIKIGENENLVFAEIHDGRVRVSIFTAILIEAVGLLA